MSQNTLVVAGGCFWCTEAVFEQLQGVNKVTCGYAGGSADSANYDAVCRGDTGHAEAIKVEYDDATIDVDTLLDVFFHVAHDPTQKDRQGNDVGTQYRSTLFYADEQQKAYAQSRIDALNAEGSLGKIVTTLEPLTAFYDAEDYHQQFARKHPMQPYIFCVARPKLKKLEKTYPNLLKNDHS